MLVSWSLGGGVGMVALVALSVGIGRYAINLIFSLEFPLLVTFLCFFVTRK